MMKVKYYKCHICNKKFKTLNGWGGHIQTTHPESIPEGYSISRFFYYTKTGKTHGVCRTCKKDTDWNEESMKYNQYCNNPDCKAAYVKIAKQRMIGKHGKIHLLNDPEMQRKMIKNRRISGKYKFQDGQEFEYVGSYEKEFLKMMDTMLEWPSNDLMAPSPHTYYYDYKNNNDDKKNWGTKFYIPDFYIPSLNLEIEIKQSTSTNKEFIAVMRVKEKLKDEVMASNTNLNYIKINDNNFTNFFEFLLKAKENIETDDEIKKNQIGAVMESYNEVVCESSKSDNSQMYFLSSISMDDEVLQPRIPENYFVRSGYEDSHTPRVCFAPSIDQCLMGLSENLEGKEFYVHIPEDVHKLTHPTKKQVPDCEITGEVWITKPVVVQCVGKIKVEKSIGDGIDFTYGNNTASLYKWKWKWLYKFDENHNTVVCESCRNVQDARKLVTEVTQLAKKYDPPYSAKQVKDKYGYAVFNRLRRDPAHKWRMDTGIELIHKEPTLEELLRIRRNWDLMSEEQKMISDKKSIEMFGMTNIEHFNSLLPDYLELTGGSEISALESEDYSIVDKRFKPKGTKRLSDFQKIKVTKNIINQYKNKIPSLRCLLDFPDNSKNISYLFLDGGKYVGTCSVCPDKFYGDGWHTKEYNVIHNLEISKPYRGYSLGKQMLDFAVNELDGNAMCVYDDNEIAKSIYKKYGFEEVEKSKADIDSGFSDRCFMVLENTLINNNELSPATESLFINKGVFDIHFDKFESGETNVVLITGLSGSGKTTLGTKIANKYKAELIELDMFEQCYIFENDDQLKQCGEVFYQYLSSHKTLWEKLKRREIHGKELGIEIDKFLKYVISWCKKDKLNRYVIEGVQIYGFLNKEKITGVSLLMVGTSALKSLVRRLIRARDNNKEDFKNQLKELPQCIAWYIDENKMFEKFKKSVLESSLSDSVSNESYVISKDDIERNVDKFISGESNIILITGLSRAGKTTLGEEYAYNYNATLIELDIFENPNQYTDNYTELKKVGKIYDLYLNKTKDGRIYRDKVYHQTDISNNEISVQMDKTIAWVLNYCKSNPNTKFVIEGLQIYSDIIDFNCIKDIPLIIKGTSMLKSFIRRSKHSFNTFKWYLEEENKLNEFRNATEALNSTSKNEKYHGFDVFYDSDKHNLIDDIDKDITTSVMEGFLDIFNIFKKKDTLDVFSWKELLLAPKGIFGGKTYSVTSLFTGARIVNGMIEIRGINYRILSNRIEKMYIDKSINNIFIPEYNALSYKRYEKKKIQKKNIKIDYIYTPEFFALELVCLFRDLGKRYNDKVYKSIANQIYQYSWLSKADKTSEITPLLNTQNLKNIRLKLESHQLEFIENYPKLKAQLNLNGYLLAFEQGLGKTLTATALAECLNVDHVYIVCPNTLKENWALEIKKYYEKYSDNDTWKSEVFICNSKPFLFDPNTTRFIITNNESIDKMIPYVLSGKNMLILDESHNFRNINSKRVSQLLDLRDKLSCLDILIMSGTPIKATPDEIVPALMMIDPTFTLDAAKIFSKAFKLKESLGTSLVQTRFGRIMYRKDKSVLSGKLPAKYVKPMLVSITGSDKYHMANVKSVIMDRFVMIYMEGESDMKKLREPFFKLADSFARPTIEEKTRFHKIVNEFTQLAAGEIHELDRDYVTDYILRAKNNMKSNEDKKYMDFLTKNYLRYRQHCLGLAMGEILPKYRKEMFIQMYNENRDIIHKMINQNVKKTLIFSQFKDVVTHIYNDLNNYGIGTVMINGDVTNRMEIMEEFKENDAVIVLTATSQTIGTGVTLTEASQMFFFGPPWRQADFDQCTDRIHRIGQTDDVYIYNVILNTGNALNLSTRMDNILQWSKNMTDSVIISTDNNEIDNVNFDNVLFANESVTQYEINEFFMVPDDTQLSVYKEVDSRLLPHLITFLEYYSGQRAIAKEAIPKNYILEKKSIEIPLGEESKASNLKYTKLGNAIANNPDNTYPNIKFDYHYDNGYEYWNIVTLSEIKKGTELKYNPKDLEIMT